MSLAVRPSLQGGRTKPPRAPHPPRPANARARAGGRQKVWRKTPRAAPRQGRVDQTPAVTSSVGARRGQEGGTQGGGAKEVKEQSKRRGRAAQPGAARGPARGQVRLSLALYCALTEGHSIRHTVVILDSAHPTKALGRRRAGHLPGNAWWAREPETGREKRERQKNLRNRPAALPTEALVVEGVAAVPIRGTPRNAYTHAPFQRPPWRAPFSNHGQLQADARQREPAPPGRAAAAPGAIRRQGKGGHYSCRPVQASPTLPSPPARAAARLPAL